MISKTQLFLEHALVTKAVFHRVFHNSPDPKSANNGIKNRVARPFQYSSPRPNFTQFPIYHASHAKPIRKRLMYVSLSRLTLRAKCQAGKPDQRESSDIEPPAKSPYTSRLIDQSNYRTQERASTPVTSHLNAPHGGKLVDLTVSASRAAEIKAQSRDWPSWDLTPRQICDLEMLCNGSFSPLTGFMKKADYESVCSKMRLADGTLWTMPITLDVSKEFAEKIKPGQYIALRDAEGVMLAVINAEDIWEPNREQEAEQVFGTQEHRAPGRQLLDEPEQAGLHRRQSRVPAASAPLRLQVAPQHAEATPRRVRQARLDARSSPSKPATRCTAPTTSSRSAPRRKKARICSSTRSSA